MSNKNLKNSFNEKMAISPSKHFEADFIKKLENEKSNKKFAVKWWGWGSAGALTLVVFLFFFQQSHDLSYPHQQYMMSVIEMDEDADEIAADDNVAETIDLTGLESDEI